MSSAVPISKKLLLINTISGMVVFLADMFIVFWWVQHLIKRVKPEEYAVLPVLMSVILFVRLLPNVLNAGLGRFITEAHAKHDDTRVTEIASTMFPLLAGIALLLLILGMIFSYFVPAIFDFPDFMTNDARLMAALLIMQLAITTACAPFSVGMFATQRFVLSDLIGVLATLLRIALLLILIVGVGPQVKWVVVAQFVASVVMAFAKLFYSRRALPALRFSRQHIRWDIARPIINFNGWSVLQQIAGVIRNGAAPLVLTKFATELDVNAYDVGGRPDRQIREMVTRITQPMMPVLTTMHAKDQSQRLTNAYIRGGRIGLWFSMAIAIPMIVFRQEFYSLYLGEKFTPLQSSATVLMLLLLTYPMFFPRWMLLKVASATDQMKLPTICMLAGQLLNLLLMLYCVIVRDMGALGAAWSTLIAAAISNVLIFWPMGFRMFRIPPGRFFVETVAAGMAPTVIGAVACEGLRRVAPPDSWIDLILVVCGGLATYFAFLLAFCLQPAEKNDLARVLKRFGFGGKTR